MHRGLLHVLIEPYGALNYQDIHPLGHRKELPTDDQSQIIFSYPYLFPQSLGEPLFFVQILLTELDLEKESQAPEVALAHFIKNVPFG